MEKEKVKVIIEEIGAVTELLYQEKMEEGYGALSVLLRHIIEATGNIVEEEEQQSFVAILQPALEAMQANDYTLLADILQYDLVEKFEEYM